MPAHRVAPYQPEAWESLAARRVQGRAQRSRSREETWEGSVPSLGRWASPHRRSGMLEVASHVRGLRRGHRLAHERCLSLSAIRPTIDGSQNPHQKQALDQCLTIHVNGMVARSPAAASSCLVISEPLLRRLIELVFNLEQLGRCQLDPRSARPNRLRRLPGPHE